VGSIGQYNQRVYLTRAGYARDWVFWARYDDPTYFGLVGAAVDITELAS
jgi:hypothetical protein